MKSVKETLSLILIVDKFANAIERYSHYTYLEVKLLFSFSIFFIIRIALLIVIISFEIYLQIDLLFNLLCLH